MGLYAQLFYAIIPTLFPCFLLICNPYSHYILMFLQSCLCHFFGIITEKQVCPHWLHEKIYAILAIESLTRLCYNNGWQRLSLSPCIPTEFSNLE